MENNINTYRKSIRLKGYNYSQNGIYFITICTYNRECLFGELDNGAIIYNKYGLIVQEEWLKSFKIRRELEIDEFIIMPNHLHGIVMINNKNKKYQCNYAEEQPIDHRRMHSQSIASLIAGFKSSVTKRINQARQVSKYPVWQRNYHEHIIRSDTSLQRLREYVIHNPYTWKEDKLFRE